MALRDRLFRPVRANTASAANAEGDPPPLSSSAKRRRQQVLSMLADRPEINYAIVSDTEAEQPDAVILTLGIRDKGTVDLRIPAERYDAFRIMEVMQEHGGGEAVLGEIKRTISGKAD